MSSILEKMKAKAGSKKAEEELGNDEETVSEVKMLILHELTHVYPPFIDKIIEQIKPNLRRELCVACNNEPEVRDKCKLCEGAGKIRLATKIQAESNPKAYLWYRELLELMFRRPAECDLMILGGDLIVVPASYQHGEPLDPAECTMAIQHAVRYFSMFEQHEALKQPEDDEQEPSDAQLLTLEEAEEKGAGDEITS